MTTMKLTYKNINTLSPEQMQDIYENIFLHGYKMWGNYQPSTINEFISNWQKQDSYNPSLVAINKKGNIVGVICVTDTTVLAKYAEIGYMVHKDYRKQGVATSMVEYFSKYLVDAYGYTNQGAVVIDCQLGKYSSQVLAKNGFKQTGVSPKSVFIEGKVTDKIYFYKDCTSFIKENSKWMQIWANLRDELVAVENTGSSPAVWNN